ncbi:NAD-dependent epimerase/dehydratase family protein [Enterococcus sp. AZ072]|uniref:NAD-dependent epimerase/dehydratase family protein n=1 Tax=unclassified Enterococcus TaxID=2608891 RepID=UPI003D27CF01
MVIVIGATGFIGLYTIERLISDGYDVIATGRNKSLAPLVESLGGKFIQLDITEKEDFNKLPTDNIDGVILLAGLLPANTKVNLDENENAYDYIATNTLGTINVLEFCRVKGIKRMISTSSYADVSSAWKKGYPIKEDEPRSFEKEGDHAAYVISKNAASDIMEYYNIQHDMRTAVFRLPPVYGVGPHSEIYVNGIYYKTGIQTFIDKAIAGEPIEIWGDPHISRDIIYVKDVAKAFSLILKNQTAKGLYNMTSSTELNLEEQVKIIIKVFSDKKESPIVYCPDKPNNTPSFLFSMEKAKRDFGFVPKYKNYFQMMNDYKRELESKRWNLLIETRRKNSGD